MTDLKVRGADGGLATRAAGREPWRDQDWQKLWLSLRGRDWSSLAVVPAGPGAPKDFALQIAVTLARIGTMHLGAPIQVADASKIPLAHLMQFNEEIDRLREEQEYVVIALAPVADNPVSVTVAQSADAAVLCVLLDHMDSGDATETVEQIGTSRFVGSVIFRGEQYKGG